MTILKKITIAGLAAAIAVPAFAQVTPPQPPVEQSQPAQAGERGERAERGERGPRREAREQRRQGQHHGQRGGQRGGFSLWNAAEKLTAARTALAIQPDQEAAWNDFTAAAIAFAQAGRPGPQGGERAQPQGAAQDGERTLNDLPAVRMLDRMVERGNERTEAAQSLRSAVDQLSGVLTPEQVETAERLLSELRGPGRRDGQRGGPRHHQERGERGGNSGR